MNEHEHWASRGRPGEVGTSEENSSEGTDDLPTIRARGFLFLETLDGFFA